MKTQDKKPIDISRLLDIPSAAEFARTLPDTFVGIVPHPYRPQNHWNTTRNTEWDTYSLGGRRSPYNVPISEVPKSAPLLGEMFQKESDNISTSSSQESVENDAPKFKGKLWRILSLSKKAKPIEASDKPESFRAAVKENVPSPRSVPASSLPERLEETKSEHNVLMKGTIKSLQTHSSGSTPNSDSIKKAARRPLPSTSITPNTQGASSPRVAPETSSTAVSVIDSEEFLEYSAPIYFIIADSDCDEEAHEAFDLHPHTVTQHVYLEGIAGLDNSDFSSIGSVTSVINSCSTRLTRVIPHIRPAPLLALPQTPRQRANTHAGVVRLHPIDKQSDAELDNSKA
ncbi:hypothetical protein C8J56DRAFT_1042789 [Mycena floridula]|nr:hypothetical protein C8J56DRAFT_1042789 [Mycena floridula]